MDTSGLAKILMEKGKEINAMLDKYEAANKPYLAPKQDTSNVLNLLSVTTNIKEINASPDAFAIAIALLADEAKSLSGGVLNSTSGMQVYDMGQRLKALGGIAMMEKVFTKTTNVEKSYGVSVNKYWAVIDGWKQTTAYQGT